MEDGGRTLTSTLPTLEHCQARIAELATYIREKRDPESLFFYFTYVPGLRWLYKAPPIRDCQEMLILLESFPSELTYQLEAWQCMLDLYGYFVPVHETPRGQYVIDDGASSVTQLLLRRLHDATSPHRNGAEEQLGSEQLVVVWMNILIRTAFDLRYDSNDMKPILILPENVNIVFAAADAYPRNIAIQTALCDFLANLPRNQNLFAKAEAARQERRWPARSHFDILLHAADVVDHSETLRGTSILCKEYAPNTIDRGWLRVAKLVGGILARHPDVTLTLRHVVFLVRDAFRSCDRYGEEIVRIIAPFIFRILTETIGDEWVELPQSCAIDLLRVVSSIDWGARRVIRLEFADTVLPFAARYIAERAVTMDPHDTQMVLQWGAAIRLLFDDDVAKI